MWSEAFRHNYRWARRHWRAVGWRELRARKHAIRLGPFGSIIVPLLADAIRAHEAKGRAHGPA